VVTKGKDRDGWMDKGTNTYRKEKKKKGTEG